MIRKLNKVTLTAWLAGTFILGIKNTFPLFNSRNDMMFYLGVVLTLGMIYGAGYFGFLIWNKGEKIE